jgi:cob(I)alamin adenosyltransferase
MEEDRIQELPIGDVAAALGVTVRTIRHYEAVGLLDPAERSYGGHRRYGEGDVARLRRIVALRRCGFGLEAIRRLLDTSSRDEALAVARRGLERAEVELDVARRLQIRMRQFADLLEGSQDESIDKLIAEMETEKMNVHLDRISTGLGDAGDTDLADGTRVPKADPVLAAVGATEELGAEIGLILAEAELADRHRAWLERIANDLFDIGSDLSSPPGGGDSRPRVGTEYVEWLEEASAEANEGLGAIDTFIVRFESPAASRLDICRTVCRRAERTFFAVEDANPQVGRYLNRLSDLLFILARAEAAGREVGWRPGQSAIY